MSTTLSQSNPVARKTHVCNMCLATIYPGDHYRRGVYVQDDGPYTLKECAHCQTLLDRVYDWADYPDEGVSEYDFLLWAQDNLGAADAREYLRRRHLLDGGAS